MHSDIFLEDNSELQATFLDFLNQAELPHPDVLSPYRQPVNHNAVGTLESLIREFVEDNDLSTEESDLLSLWSSRYLDVYQFPLS